MAGDEKRLARGDLSLDANRLADACGHVHERSTNCCDGQVRAAYRLDTVIPQPRAPCRTAEPLLGFSCGFETTSEASPLSSAIILMPPFTRPSDLAAQCS